jgi:ATP-dependent DNA helicase RecG
MAIAREDRLPVPAEALREVILNAVIHRDFSRPGSYVAVAVFDDRIEVRSVGEFPTGIRAEALSVEHPSVLRNPLIAGAFHRTGAVEVWGRGTNRVIEACEAHGIAPPTFTQEAGVVTVTFRVAVGLGTELGHQVGTKLGPSRDQVEVLELSTVPRSIPELMAPFGRTNRTKFRDQVMAPLLAAGLLEMTIPDKPRSPRQQYRTTAAGRAALRGRR